MMSLAEASLTEDERRLLDEFVARLREELGDRLHGVWLYGSRARGEEPGPDSDVDLLVVAAGGRREDGDRVWRVLREAREATGVPSWNLMPHVWDPEQVAQRRRIRSFFIQEVDRDKIVLAGSP